MLGEVGIVLDVERGERKFADEAAGGDPGIVCRSRATAQPGVGLDLAPAGGDVLVVGKDDERGECPRRVQAARAPSGGRGPT